MAALSFSIWRSVSHPDDPGEQTLLIVYGMYAGGVVLWSGLRLVVDRAIALVLAAGTLILSMPLRVAAASLGYWSLVGPLAGIGGAVASLFFPQRDWTNH